MGSTRRLRSTDSGQVVLKLFYKGARVFDPDSGMNSECWVRLTRIPKTYHTVWLGMKFTYIHTLSAIIFLGHSENLGKACELHHLCNNPACFNPAHIVVISTSLHKILRLLDKHGRNEITGPETARFLRT